MANIVYKRVPYSRITKDFLKGYKRTNTTRQVYYMDQGTLKIKDDYFEEDWDNKKLENNALELKREVKNGGVVFAAFDGNQVVGFASLENKIYKNKFIDMPFIHTSADYRGLGIGDYLFKLIVVASSKYKAKKLYISAHPDIKAQKFYKRVGCIPTDDIIEELLEREPLDIQLEYQLDVVNDTIKLLHTEVSQHEKMNASMVAKITSKMYQYMPVEDIDYINVCKQLMISDTRFSYSLGTSLIKKRPSVIHEKNMKFFEEILLNHIHGWGQVDQFCYRVMNPMIELKDEYYEYILKWSKSNNKDVRRASLVSMIQSKGTLKVEYDFDKVLAIVEQLKNDEDIHVRKAVGWVLKCTYFKYPERLEAYLRNNHDTLDRLIFRYALEHIKNPLRNELLNL